MKFEQSRQMYQRACKTCPGGIHSNVRKNWNPAPMFYQRGEGARVWDVDGNEFIDYVLARGPLLLGHSPKSVIEAAARQMERGLMYAGQHPLEIEAAEKFCQMVPGAGSVRFACTGSEAVHGAIRLARAVTSRTKIIRFEGHYHGWFDNVFWNFAPPLSEAGPRAPNPIPISQGQVSSDGSHLVIRPWNDLELVAAAFKQHPGQIAAVLTEPIMCNTGCIMPREGYLEGLRELCTRHGAEHAHAMGRQLMEGIKQAGRQAGKNVHVRGIPPIFHVSFGALAEVTDYRSYVPRDVEAYRRFNTALQERGIRTVPDGQWFVSTAHAQEDIDQTLVAVAESMEEV